MTNYITYKLPDDVKIESFNKPIDVYGKIWIEVFMNERKTSAKTLNGCIDTANNAVKQFKNLMEEL